MESDERGVFYGQEPEINTLKTCSFVWNQITVYPRFLQSLEQGQEELQALILKLFENNILKVIASPEDIPRLLYDKIAVGVNESIHKLLLGEPDQFTVEPMLPENHQELAQAGGKQDFQNLSEEMETYARERERELLRTAGSYKHSGGRYPEADKALDAGITKLLEISDRYGRFRFSESDFSYFNKLLLIQRSISSAMLADDVTHHYYLRKFGTTFADTDARRASRGLEVVLPLADVESIELLSIEDILNIREWKSWRTASERLQELCTAIKYEPFKPEFTDSVKTEVLVEFRDALSSFIPTPRQKVLSLGKKIGKLSLSVIIPGSDILLDPVDSVVSHILQKEKQKNLAVFLIELQRKYGI